jgi:hypothetical protein
MGRGDVNSSRRYSEVNRCDPQKSDPPRSLPLNSASLDCLRKRNHEQMTIISGSNQCLRFVPFPSRCGPRPGPGPGSAGAAFASPIWSKDPGAARRRRGSGSAANRCRAFSRSLSPLSAAFLGLGSAAAPPPSLFCRSPGSRAPALDGRALRPRANAAASGKRRIRTAAIAARPAGLRGSGKNNAPHLRPIDSDDRHFTVASQLRRFDSDAQCNATLCFAKKRVSRDVDDSTKRRKREMPEGQQ